MRRCGATRHVVLFRGAGPGVTGGVPRGCGTKGGGQGSDGIVDEVDGIAKSMDYVGGWRLGFGRRSAKGVNGKKNGSIRVTTPTVLYVYAQKRLCLTMTKRNVDIDNRAEDAPNAAT